MRLTRITKIKAHRVFRDFAWPGNLHPFGQFNVIYGWNGCGKTTLSSLLALVEKKAVLSEGELELELDGTTKITGTELGTRPVPQVRVFNRNFINATLHSAGSIAPIYFLGEKSVEKQAEIDRLKRDLVSANVELEKATNQKRSSESKLDEFCIQKAKLIKETLTSSNSPSYNNYDKRRYKTAAAQMTAESVIAARLSDEDKARLRSQKDAQRKEIIDGPTVPLVDLPRLKAEVASIVDRPVVAHTLDELAKNAEIGTWVQRGLALHSNAWQADTCRFCEQPLTAERRSAIEAHFNDAFGTFQKELYALELKLEAVRKSFLSCLLPEVAHFYDYLIGEAKSAIGGARAALTEAITNVDALRALVRAKRENPFGSVPQAPLDLAGDCLRDSFKAINACVDKHNRTTENFQRSIKEACEGLERCYVAEAHEEYVKLAKAVKATADEVQGIKDRPAAIQRDIDTLEREIVEHRRPADELTKELRAYLGRDELSFEIEGTGYSLTRDGRPVMDLSEGERTAITFLYFLKSLQDKAFDLGNGIVVIDDPVSSLDANALFSAFGYMKDRTQNCGQLFILTHSFPFFRLVKNWFHHLRGQRKSNLESRPARFFMLRSGTRPSGPRTAELGRLDPLLEEFESEYQYLFKRVYEEAHRSEIDSLEHHYGLPNVARRLIEAFLAFRFPDLGGDLGPRLERVSFDSAKKIRILRLLNTYSHAGAITDPEHDLHLLAETQPVLLEVLEMMKVVDKEHYEGLEKLVAKTGPL